MNLKPCSCTYLLNAELKAGSAWETKYMLHDHFWTPKGAFFSHFNLDKKTNYRHFQGTKIHNYFILNTQRVFHISSNSQANCLSAKDLGESQLSGSTMVENTLRLRM